MHILMRLSLQIKIFRNVMTKFKCLSNVCQMTFDLTIIKMVNILSKIWSNDQVIHLLPPIYVDLRVITEKKVMVDDQKIIRLFITLTAG
jgi:hypothetical protein